MTEKKVDAANVKLGQSENLKYLVRMVWCMLTWKISQSCCQF